MEAPDIIILRPTTNSYPTPAQNPPDLTYEPRNRVRMESPPPNITGHDFRNITSAVPVVPTSAEANPQGDVTRSGEAISAQRQTDGPRESDIAQVKQRLFYLEDRIRSVERNVKWNSRLIKLLFLTGGIAAIYLVLTKQKS